ncbi:zinc-binding metallopeptidase [Pedobacter sp. WC2501]|uniref:zinc-binding metallopeptidase n=1 Tax=Pedobacter sp. WC2501 TaxID=3461400 RepID=UPI004045C347
MKIKFSIFYIALVGICLTFSSCKKETLPETPIVGLGGDTWVKGNIDSYIKLNFTDPYNIQVKYKWDPYETSYNKNITPVNEDNVIPALDAVQKIWIAPYKKVSGDDFLRRYSPKEYVMYGSASYNSDGTITLGEAEGGKKITLFVINTYDRKNVAEVKRMLHTIHHEFAHILHQNILYPREFKQLNPQWYTASWFNTDAADANAQGLVTPYAKAAVDEDWVETIAYLLVEGQTAFDALVTANPGTAALILRTKEAMIVEYYRSAYSIDFRALQTEVKNGIALVTN